MSEVRITVSKYLSKAESISNLDLASSFTNVRKAVEAIAEYLYSDQPKEIIPIMRRLKNLRDLGIITKEDCKSLISIVAETNKHCHHNANSNPVREIFEQLISRLSDTFFSIFDDYIVISDDTDVSLLNQRSIQDTALNISASPKTYTLDDELLEDIMIQAQLCISEHQYELAEQFTTFSLEGFMKSKNEVSICRCKLLLSDIYTLQNRLSLATQFAEEGLILASKLELNREQGWALHNLGIIHDRINDYVRARFFYERAINAYKTSDYDNVDLAKIQNSLAMSYIDYPESMDLEQAEILLKEAYTNIEGREIPNLRGSLLACISFVEEKKENFSVSLELAYEARKFYRIAGVQASLLKKLDKKIKFLKKREKRKR